MTDKQRAADRYRTSYQSLPQLPAMVKLWHHGYWDGPLNGVCEVDGHKCWFQMLEEWEDDDHYRESDPAFEQPWYRRFLVWRLTDEQFARLETDHNKFRRMVGWHTDYDANGSRLDRFHPGHQITQESEDQYFAEHKADPTFSIEPETDEHILGWFEL